MHLQEAEGYRKGEGKGYFGEKRKEERGKMERVGRCMVTLLPNFLGWVVYLIFLPMVLRCARFARESSAIVHS